MSHVFPLRETAPSLRRLALVAAILAGFSAAAVSCGPRPAHAQDDFTASAVEIDVGQGHGSGVYIGKGYVLTAAHVAEVATDGTVTVKRQRSAEWTDSWVGEVVWMDKRQDFALVRIKAILPDDMTKAAVSCAKPTMKQDVTVVGWPVDLGRIQSRGYVAGDADKRGPWAVSYVVVAPIFFGNSGGPVYNDKGELIALAVGILQGTSLSIVVPTSAVCDQLPAGLK